MTAYKNTAVGCRSLQYHCTRLRLKRLYIYHCRHDEDNDGAGMMEWAVKLLAAVDKVNLDAGMAVTVGRLSSAECWISQNHCICRIENGDGGEVMRRTVKLSAAVNKANLDAEMAVTMGRLDSVKMGSGVREKESEFLV